MSLLTSAATMCWLLLMVSTGAAEESKTSSRLDAVDIYVDSGTKPLAAYQLEFWVGNGGAKIVGVEGGSHAAFREAPFYDPKAIQKERVVIAAYNTSSAEKLPKGKTHVATIHLQITGSRPPEFDVKITTAGSVDGKKISVSATFETKHK